MTETTISAFFDEITVINLDRRVDRMEHFVKQAKYLGIHALRFPAFDGNTLTTKPGKPPHPGWSTISMGNYGNVLSQIAVIRGSQFAELDKILILEDDVDFVGPNHAISSFLDKVPKNWDMVYFGGNHVEPLIPIDDTVGRCQFTLTAHAVGIRSTMFEHLIHYTRHANIPIDLYYAQLHKQYNVYCPLVGLATQMNGYSDIESKDVDYTKVIK